MKFRRILSTAAALVLALSLTVVSASAVTFKDLTGHWSKNDVEALASQGIINGYADNTFKPDAKMSAAEALLFCARVTGLDSSTKSNIASAYADELRLMLPASMASWAAPEMGICLETGILSRDELSSMCTSGAISQAITRETLSKYLVRAIQMAPTAENLSIYSLSFADTSSISPSLQPYVYLLYTYGIVGGNNRNEFMPKSAVSRAEMATLLKRALDFMHTNGVTVELPQYTTNEWFGGTILSATAGKKGTIQLTLNSTLSGTRSVTLPANAAIYDNNRRSSSSALQTGKYARVNLDRLGTPESVRVSGELTTLSGTVSGLTTTELALSVEGDIQRYSIDRFTQIQAGKEVGDSSVIDLGAGYSSAVCQVDKLGHLACVQLSGGSRQEMGILKSVEFSSSGGLSIQVAGFNGEIQRYALPASASVLIDGLMGSLTSSYVDDCISMRISEETPGQISSLSVDTHTKYIQGSIRNVRTSKSPDTITVNNFSNNKSTTYPVASGAQISYNGEEVSISKVKNGWFATLRLSSNNEITMLDGYPGSTSVYGAITAIHYGATTTLDVKLTDGSIASYSIDLTDPPVLYRGEDATTIDKLRTGDQVELTIRYNEVERIKATPQDANRVGVIQRITMETSGITLDLLLTDGTSVSYLVTDGVSVTQDNNAVSLYSLKPGYKVALVVADNQVISIDVDKSSGSSTQISGTVLYINTSDQTILLQWTDSAGKNSLVTVNTRSASILRIDGSAISLDWLKSGDSVQIYGAYEGLNFRASLILVT